MAITFQVIAGKLEDPWDGVGAVYENVKYSCEFDSWEEAQKAIYDNSLNTYHFCRVEIEGF